MSDALRSRFRLGGVTAKTEPVPRALAGLAFLRRGIARQAQHREAMPYAIRTDEVHGESTRGQIARVQLSRQSWEQTGRHAGYPATSESGSLGSKVFTGAARYTLVAVVYIALYAGLERLSLVYEFRDLGISLWTPAIGLSIALLLAEGLIFVPMLFVAIFLTNLYVHAVPLSISSIAITAAILTLGYSSLAAALRYLLGFDVRSVRLGDVFALLVAVPAGMCVISLAYCSALYLLGNVPLELFWDAVRNNWIGDTVGTVIVVPAVMAAFSGANQWGHIRVNAGIFDYGLFLLGIAGAFWMIFGPRHANEFQFFYLIFLPVIWIAIRGGFVGAAAGILLLHLVLVAITTLDGYHAADFMAFQMLMLALATTGLLLGAMVTERRETEERVREQQAELSRMMRYTTAGAMAVTLAHQISQPLSTVATYVHAARRLFRSDHPDPVAISDALEKAEAETSRAREVLERVREFLSRGKVELAPIDLTGLASKIAALSAPEASTRRVQIKVDCPHPATVTADPVQIEQVLLNLVSNAVDAAAERGDSKGLVTVRIARRDNVECVIVEDNGPGLAVEIADRLFVPFETTKRHGMGLGLPLCRQIIEAHAGRLVWVGLVPQGTRFMFELHVEGPERYVA